jgi:hypothetical protein
LQFTVAKLFQLDDFFITFFISKLIAKLLKFLKESKKNSIIKNQNVKQ